MMTWGQDSLKTAHYHGFFYPDNLRVPIQRPTNEKYKYLPNAIDISASYGFSLAALADGRVLGWGENVDGNLGNGRTKAEEYPVEASGITDATTVAAGGSHSLAIRRTGTVLAWGDNYHGQVGDGTGGAANRLRTTPRPVVGLSDVVAVEAGMDFSLALKSDGTVWSWGANWVGQLGQGVLGGLWPRPTRIPGLSDVVKISSNSIHSLAVKRDGTVWAWGGYNEYGELGNGTSSLDRSKRYPTPAQVKDLSNVVDASAGGGHGVAVTSDGSLWSWGANRSGQLGIDNDQVQISTLPVKAVELPDEWDPTHDVVDVEAGTAFTLAIRRNGTVLGWGHCGQLGHNLHPERMACHSGVTVDRPLLTDYVWDKDRPASYLDRITKISAGYDHVMVLRTP